MFMPRTSSIENPFAPEKLRSSDDAKFVGDVLGSDAEKAMRKALGSQQAPKPEPAADLELTEEDRARIAEERKERSPEWKIAETRKGLLAWWAQEIGKDKEFPDEIFAITSDGLIEAKENLILRHIPTLKRLPRELIEIHGSLDLSFSGITSFEFFPQKIHGDCILNRIHATSLKGLENVSIDGSIKLLSTGITSLHGLPQKIGGSLDLRSPHIISLNGLPQKINGNLHLGGTAITSLDGLPPPENIGGIIYFDPTPKQCELKEKAERIGYRVGLSSL